MEVGVEGYKGSVDVSLIRKGRTRHVGEMFVKQGLDRERVLATYTALKKAFLKAYEEKRIDYIPLVPTLRINGKNIVMTNMNAGNNVIIDRHFGRLINLGEYPRGIRLKNTEDVIEKVGLIHQIANEADIYLSKDSYSVITDRKTGVGKPYLLDLGHVIPFSDSAVLGWDEDSLRNLDAENVEMTQNSIRNFERTGGDWR